jgi:transposase
MTYAPEHERSYSTDLTDAEWGCWSPMFRAPSKRGRPKTHSTREILTAVFYVLKSGCPWRLLPRDFPPWETVCLLVVREVAHRRDLRALNAALRELLRVR